MKLKHLILRQILKEDLCDPKQLDKCDSAYVVHMNVRFPMKLRKSLHLMRLKVVLKGKWDEFARQCGFAENKMMRLKLVSIVNEDVDGGRVKVAVFNVC